MSQFYARYIPPIATKDSQPKNSSSSPKRSNAEKPPRESKRRKLDEQRVGKNVIPERSAGNFAQRPAQQAEKLKGPEERVVEEVQPARRKPRHEQGSGVEREQEELTSVAHDPNGSISLGIDGASSSKHTKVLSRFSKSREKASRREGTALDPAPSLLVDHVHPDRANTVHDLKPIPQPTTIAPDRPAPSYSTAPQWLRTPLKVNHNDRRKFQELGLSKQILHNLVSQHKQDALPVQSAVLPLLLDREVHQRPDLCVAAATGSGKTFAYVLPILSALRKRQRPRLRAVIVVPTRALVKQAVHALESCSAGLDIRVGTAEGSKTFVEEQRQLVEETMVYDPDEYKRQREAPVDWDTFSLDALIDQANQKESTPQAGYIQIFLSKVDVLVCTPGRLVEHLQTTKGFSLDDVQWFVADEADRLLNESYHEWLETVMPALKSQKATEQRDSLLKQMHMDVPKRRVTKILLSATMTSDISQLLGLELTGPKLVVVEDAEAQLPTRDKDIDMADVGDKAEFSIPPRLVEFAIALKDSENKPLYLLELLEKHILHHDPAPQETRKKAPINGTMSHDRKPQSDDDTSSSSSDSDDAATDDTTSSSASNSDARSDVSSVSPDDTSSSGSGSDSPSSTSSTSSDIKQTTTTSTKQPGGQPRSRVLVFTRSTEAAHRLSHLLSLLNPSLAPLIATFTRSSSTNDFRAKKTKPLSRTRSRVLQSFTAGRTHILISTDVAARGLDIPNLEHVLNYDVPPSPLIYVHRVGRTARAGQAGHAWTLVEHRQGKWFWETIGGKVVRDAGVKTIGRGEKVVQKVNLVIDKEKWMSKYEDALRQLGEDVRGQ